MYRILHLESGLFYGPASNKVVKVEVDSEVYELRGFKTNLRKYGKAYPELRFARSVSGSAASNHFIAAQKLKNLIITQHCGGTKSLNKHFYYSGNIEHFGGSTIPLKNYFIITDGENKYSWEGDSNPIPLTSEERALFKK